MIATCIECKTQLLQGSRFCHSCGSEMHQEIELPYIGELTSLAVYRITFDPIEEQFTSEDAAREAAEHSCWDEDRSFSGYKIELLRSSVPKEEYPYICGKCAEVVTTEKLRVGRCQNCNAVDAWRKRS